MTDVVSPIIQPTVEAPKEPTPPVKPNDVIIDTPPADTKSADIENFVPLNKYSEDKNRPFTADYLGVFYWDALTPEMDVNGIIPDVALIDHFIAQEINNNKLTQTIGSYKEVMNNILRTLNISTNATVESKIERIKAYIQMLDKNHERKIKDEYLDKVAKKLKSKGW